MDELLLQMKQTKFGINDKTNKAKKKKMMEIHLERKMVGEKLIVKIFKRKKHFKTSNKEKWIYIFSHCRFYIRDVRKFKVKKNYYYIKKWNRNYLKRIRSRGKGVNERYASKNKLYTI